MSGASPTEGMTAQRPGFDPLPCAAPAQLGDFVIAWSEPGRRSFPYDSATLIMDVDGNRRCTIRATYRVLRGAMAPWQARMVIARLVQLEGTHVCLDTTDRRRKAVA